LLYLGELLREILPLSSPNAFFSRRVVYQATLNDESLGSSLLLIFLEDLLRQVRRIASRDASSAAICCMSAKRVAADDGGRFLAYHGQQNRCFSRTTQG